MSNSGIDLVLESVGTDYVGVTLPLDFQMVMMNVDPALSFTNYKDVAIYDPCETPGLQMSIFSQTMTFYTRESA